MVVCVSGNVYVLVCVVVRLHQRGWVGEGHMFVCDRSGFYVRLSSS